MPPARRRLLFPLAGIVIASSLTTACVVEHVRAVPAAVPDERAQVATGEAEERALRARVEAYDDPDLAEYLARIVDRLLSEDERASDASPITVTVLRDPTLSAFAMPTGRIFVHTGLLARLDNEAQLAMVLARELGHAGRDHSARRAKRIPTGEVVATIARSINAATASPARDDAANAVLSPTFRAIVSTPLAAVYSAAVEGYDADLAREADAGAVERIVRASYDPREASRAFEHLRRTARAGGVIERFFYGSEPALTARIESVMRLATTEATAGVAPVDPGAAKDAFTAALLPVLRDNAKLELGAGRFRLAQEQLDRALALAPEDPLLHLAYGDLHRLRAQRARSVADQDELARRAFDSYQRCAELDPEITEVQRQLGLLYYQLRRIDRAREAFERYLALRPDAPDAARVREYLAER